MRDYKIVQNCEIEMLSDGMNHDVFFVLLRKININIFANIEEADTNTLCASS